MKKSAETEHDVYDVILTSNIQDGVTLDQVKAAVAALFHIDPAVVSDLFSGKERRIKRRLPKDRAERLAKALNDAGAVVRIQLSTSDKAHEEHKNTAESVRNPPVEVLPRDHTKGDADSARTLVPSGIGNRSLGKILVAGLLAGLALGYLVAGPFRTTVFGLTDQEKDEIELLRSEVNTTEREIAAADTTNAALSGGLRKAFVQSRLEILRMTKALLDQRIQAIRAGSRIRFDAQALKPDTQRAEQLTKEIDQQRREVETARIRAETKGGLTGAISHATLATQEQILATLRLAQLSARFGLAIPTVSEASPADRPGEPVVAQTPSSEREAPYLAVYEGPFGLKKGIPVADFGAIPIPGSPGKYFLSTVPTPHHAFEKYVAQAPPNTGLCWVKGIGRTISTDTQGIALRSKYTEMRDKLAKAYGRNYQETDFLLPGSIWNEQRDWMTGLKKKERVLMSLWKTANGALPYDLYTVGVVASALSSDKGYISVEYQFDNEAACEDEISAKADKGL
jgi:hypothetical protein